MSEGTGQTESPPVTKRKEAPGVESRGREKRPRIEGALDAVENSSGTPNKREQKGIIEEQSTPSLPDSRLDFVAVDRYRLPDKGEGSSRGRTKQQQVQKQVRDIPQPSSEEQDNNESAFAGRFSLPPIEILLWSQDKSDEEKDSVPEAGARSSASDGDEVDMMLRIPDTDTSMVVAENVYVYGFLYKYPY